MQVVAAAMMTMFITVLGVALWDMQGLRVNNSKEVADNGDVRVIGSLPALSGRRAGGLLPMTENSKRMIEVGLTRSIDSIRTALQFADSSRPYNTVMITSALGQEGKTTVASQLAVSFARAGRRTLLIDADFRSPQQHTVVGMPFQRGLCDLLRSDASLDDVVQPTPAEGLWLMCAGHRDANTDQALSSSIMSTILSELRSQFDMVIIDTGPVLTCPDAMLIGQNVDTAVLSIRRDSSRIPKVNEACNRLRSVGVHIAGAVLNGVSMDIRESELRLDSSAIGNEPQLEQSV
jgi:capsular exopolysaccharide synthesis family protein